MEQDTIESESPQMQEAIKDGVQTEIETVWYQYRCYYKLVRVEVPLPFSEVQTPGFGQ